MLDEFSLILNCGGYSFDNFILCGGTQNIIINFGRHFENEELTRIMDFLDYTCGLLDIPITDWNKIVNTLKMFRERYSLIDDKTWEALFVWLPQHKRCGAVIRLMANTELNKKPKNDEELIMSSSIRTA